MEMVGEPRRKKGMYQGIGDFCDRDRQTQGERDRERGGGRESQSWD